ncbi:MAG TPA: hypothetical protein VGM12_16945, partial [Trebonia sp.]
GPGTTRQPAEPEKPLPDNVASRRLTCGQPSSQDPFPQVSPKREDLTCGNVIPAPAGTGVDRHS